MSLASTYEIILPLPRMQSTGSSPQKISQILSLGQAILLTALILLLSGFVTVLVTSLREEPAFTAPKTIYLPQREPEHLMAVAEFQNAAATPTMMPSLNTESLLATIPVIPRIPDVEFNPVEAESIISESDALFGESGLMGSLSALSSQASSISFLGISEEASRVIIMADTSDSVVNSVRAAGTSMDQLREEIVRLIQSLNANTLFGFIQHSRKYDPFQDQLIPATMANKALAIEWLNSKFGKNRSGSNWRSGPAVGTYKTGLLTILNFAFKMQPDVLFLISDGGYFGTKLNGGQSPIQLSEVHSLINRRQKEMIEDTRIHTIHFPDPRDIQDGRIGPDMRSIAKRNNGKYKKISR